MYIRMHTKNRITRCRRCIFGMHMYMHGNLQNIVLGVTVYIHMHAKNRITIICPVYIALRYHSFLKVLTTL